MTVPAPKRNVGMTVRFTMEDHDRFTKAAEEMGYKRFSPFVRHCLHAIVTNESLVDHHKDQKQEIKRLQERVELKDEQLERHKRWLEETQSEVREVRAEWSAAEKLAEEGWRLAKRGLLRIICARLIGRK